jgi:aminopeptidase N
MAESVLVWVLCTGTGCTASPGSGATDEPAPCLTTLQTWALTPFDQTGSLPVYVIQAALNDTGEEISGSLTVQVTNTGRDEWPDLVFRLYPNTVQYAARMDIADATVDARPALTELTPDQTTLRVVPATSLAAGTSVTVSMRFTVQLPRRSSGYTLFGWEHDVLSLPGFYPMLAVHSRDRWETPTPPIFADVLFSPVACYDLKFTAPADLTIVASGATLGTTDAGRERLTWHIAGAPLRDLTLLASRRWQSVSDTAAGATVTSYYPTGLAAAGEAALFHAAAALRLFSDLYGPYPFREYKVVAAPVGHRGMEYSGLVTIGDELYGERRDDLAFLVAHETAHQWWYAQVGNPWLDEGLAEYAAFDYYQSIYGRAAAAELLSERWQTPVKFGDARGIEGAIDRPADHLNARSYEMLAYAKAALFFNALREQVGDETYYTALRAYVEAYRWQTVTPQQFLGLIQSVSGTSVSALAEMWLR